MFSKGFSLMEVLVALLLATGASLALLKQQWQVNQQLNQVLLRAGALVQLDNASERVIIGYSIATVEKPYQLTVSRQNEYISLMINWKSPYHAATQSFIQRNVAVEP